MASSSSIHGDDSLVQRLINAAGYGNLPEFKRLVKEYRRLGLRMEDARNPDQTCFHIAAVSANTHICSDWALLGPHYQTALYLLEKGANPNFQCPLLRTSLHYAVESGSKKLVQLVIKKGAKVDAVADCGTPLVHAAFRGRKDIVKLLIDNGADVNVISYELKTPLLSAILCPSVECVKLLLKEGADPNLYGSRRFMPLAQAARDKEAEMVTCLLDAGANPNITSAMGLIPIEIAAWRDFLQGVMILFPKTCRIPTIPEWNVAGIIKHSRRAVLKVMESFDDHFKMSKSKGEEAFKKKDYYGAIKWYTEAYHCQLSDGTMLSNISLCWARLNEGGIALKEAQSCIDLKPEWPKGYYREGAAYMLLKKYEKASESFHRAWMKDPQNKELERAFSEAVEAQLRNAHHIIEKPLVWLYRRRKLFVASFGGKL